MVVVTHQAEKIWIYDRATVRPTVQGAAFNMRGQLYRGHAYASALSSSPVVSALGSESDDPFMYIINHKNWRNSPFQFQYWTFSLKNMFDVLDTFIAAGATFPLHGNLYNPRSERVSIHLTL